MSHGVQRPGARYGASATNRGQEGVPVELLPLVLLGFVLPMGEDATPQLLNDPRLAAVLAGVSVLLCTYTLLGTRPHPSPGRWSQLGAISALIYGAVLAAATFTRTLPEARYSLYFFFPVALYCFYCIEGVRPGSWAIVVYFASLMHITWALALGDRTLIASGAERLSGGTHPVLLGFESAAVIVLSANFALRTKSRVTRSLLAIATIAGTYTLFAAFSRAAIIALAGGLVLMAIFRTQRMVALKFVYSVVAGVMLAVLAWPFFLGFLGGADPDSVTNASGRYEIWPRVLNSADEPVRGYGFASLHDGEGPDQAVYRANHGLPVENSLLQAYLMAGYAAGASWLLLIGNAARTLWAVRAMTRGTSLALLLLILVDAIYGVGMSGVSSSWWWLLAAFSVGDAVVRSGNGRGKSTAPDPEVQEDRSPHSEPKNEIRRSVDGLY